MIPSHALFEQHFKQRYESYREHLKLKDAITRDGLALPLSYPKQWIVDCQSVGSDDKALVYLGRSLYRGIIQERDLVACEDGQVNSD